MFSPEKSAFSLEFQGNKLKVEFDEQLAVISEEIRKLYAFGFCIPPEIQNFIVSNQKAFRYGKILKRIATFYNNIDVEVYPFLAPLLCSYSHYFRSLIQSSESYSLIHSNWNETKFIHRHISKLQKAADNIISENSRLRQAHLTIMSVISRLCDVDIIKKQKKWRDDINTIQTMLNSVTGENVDLSATLPWRVHLDHQLLKILEYEQRMRLEFFQFELKKCAIDVTLRNGKVQFKPSLEELRLYHYREIKRIINIPESRTLLGNSNVFSNVKLNNAEFIFSTFFLLENIFRKLVKSVEMYAHHIPAEADSNLEDFIFFSFKDIIQWEKSFKAIKSKSIELNCLPSQYCVEWFLLNTVPIKAQIEEAIEFIFKALIGSLKRRVNVKISDINSFIGESMRLLQSSPKSVSEIKRAEAEFIQISGKMASFNDRIKILESENKVLESVSIEGNLFLS